jgi:AcrR family transcriptional regulator
MSPRRYSLGQREASVDQTRERILVAARDVLATQDALTVDAVARAADVARATVYNQFTSKSGLLDALFDWLAQRGGLTTLPAVFMQADPDLALEAFITTFGVFWASDQLVLRRLRALAALDAELGVLVRARDEWRRGGLRRLLERRGEARGDIVDVLHVLTSFETFDTLIGEQRTPEEATRLLVRVALSLVAQ